MKTQTPKNRFTQSDTRFRQIRNLETKNRYLTKQLTHLQNDVLEIDEFKVAIQIDRNLTAPRSLIFNQMDFKKGKISLDDTKSDYHQMRVDILKAQLQKQNRYIKRITTVLQTTRKFYEDIREYLKYFGQILRGEHDKLYQMDGVVFDTVAQARDAVEKHSEHIARVPIVAKAPEMEDSFDRSHPQPRITKEKEILDALDKKQAYVSLKNLLQTFRSNEERENFTSNFNLAYNKVIDAERLNVDFRNLIEVRDRQIVYKHPIRGFIKQFGGLFPVRSIYHGFPMKEREKLDNFILMLDSMGQQIQRDLCKIDTFWLFKSNPFYYYNDNQINLPAVMMEENQLFDVFLQEPEKYRIINLDQKLMANVEKDLITLLDKLLILQKTYQQQTGSLQFLQNGPITQLGIDIRKSLESLVCISSMISNTNLQLINKVQVVSEKEAYLYNYQVFAVNDFQFKYQQQEQLLGDLHALVPITELSIVKKAMLVNRGLKNVFEIEQMIALLRETEINYLRQKLTLMLQDYENVFAFITEAERKIKVFFSQVTSKFNAFLTQYTLALEQDRFMDQNFRKQFQQTMKKAFKDISDFINSYMQLNTTDNSINIRQLQQEFEKKVSSFYIRSETLQKINEQISKKLS